MRTLDAPGPSGDGRRSRPRLGRAVTPDRRRLARFGRRILVIYWAVCLGVIAWGLDRLHPQPRETIVEEIRTHWGDHPFPNCAAAHAAGVYDIPSWSPAYVERQDGDGDGLACEPPPHLR